MEQWNIKLSVPNQEMYKEYCALALVMKNCQIKTEK
jgi:hypothetical protein